MHDFGVQRHKEVKYDFEKESVKRISGIYVVKEDNLSENYFTRRCQEQAGSHYHLS